MSTTTLPTFLTRSPRLRSEDSAADRPRSSIAHTVLPFSSALDRLEAETLAEINVMLVYQNISTALWATETLADLLQQIQDGPEPRLSPSNFSRLEKTDSLAPAINPSARTNLIIIASSGGFRALPSTSKHWLDKSQFERCGAAAAISALNGNVAATVSSDFPPLSAMLHLANEAGCKFFIPNLKDSHAPPPASRSSGTDTAQHTTTGLCFANWQSPFEIQFHHHPT